MPTTQINNRGAGAALAIYVVHADADRASAEELQVFLTAQIRAGQVSLNGRFRFSADGSAAQRESEGIASADIVVLLVSARLLLERDEAVQLAMVRARLGLCPVVPVLVGKALLRDTAFSGLVSLPREGPVSLAADKDSAWVEIAEGLLRVVAELPARRQRLQAQAVVDEGKVRVLFAAANPLATSRLQVSRELMQVRGRLEQLGVSSGFALIDKRDMDLGELAAALLMHRPQIVHFCGHSQRDGALLFHGIRDEAMAISDEALRQLFGALPERPRLLLLNTCFAGTQAAALEGVVDTFIGHLDEVRDADAILFADILYTNLALGRSVKEAQQQAQAALAGKTRTVLRFTPGSDPGQVRVR